MKKNNRWINLAILIAISCSHLIISSCTSEKIESISGPIRLFDDAEFAVSLHEYYRSLRYEKKLKMDSEQWVKVENATENSTAAYFFPLPQDLVIPFQESEEPNRIRILIDGNTITQHQNRDRKSNVKEYWKYSSPKMWAGSRRIDPGKTTFFRIGAEYSYTRLIINFEDIGPGSSLQISLDGQVLDTVFGKPDHTAVFDSRITTKRGNHRIEIAHMNQEGGYRAAVVKRVLIGLAEGILFLSKSDPRNTDTDLYYKAVLPAASSIIKRVTLENNHFFSEPGFPDKSLSFSGLLSVNQHIDATYRCMPVFSPYSGSWSGRLPDEDPLLCFSYAYVSGFHGRGDGLLVSIRPVSSSEQGESAAIYLENIGRMTWYEDRIDLSRWAGQEVEISFQYNCAPIDNFDERHLLIGEPMIISRGGIASADKSNVVLISLDTCRGDRRAGAGWKRDTMPFLDKLADEAIEFTDTYSQTSWTLPSHKSMFTGLYPHTINYLSGRFRNDPPLPANLPTLGTILKEQGYLNQAFTESAYVSALYGYGYSFDGIEEFNKPWGSDMEINGTTRIIKKIGWQRAHRWLNDEANTKSPFFLFLHTYGPHVPYSSLGYDGLFADEDPKSNLPPDIRGKLDGKPGKKAIEYLGIAYDRNLRRTDDALRSIIATLKRKGLYENTLLIVTSDHGEMLGEHDENGGHGTAWNAVLHIPLIIRLPHGENGGIRITSETQLVDLTPTVLDLLGLPVADYMQGESLVPIIRGSAVHPEPFRFSEFQYDWITHRDGDYRLQFNKESGIAIYDMVNDSGEMNNLAEGGRIPAEKISRMTRSLMLFQSELVPGWNILIQPVPGKKLRVDIEDFKWPFDSREGKMRNTDLGAFTSHVNMPSIEVTDKPALLQLEPPTEKTFTLSIKEYDNVTKTWEPLEISVGVQFGTSERQTPAQISLEMVKEPTPSFRERGAAEWFTNYPVCVWFSRVPLEFLGEKDVSQLSDEQLQALRNLGYLQ